jgi:acetyl-CoA carboxylase biotin carboxylase subunit
MPKRKIKRLLVANRGEIALRIIRTCREMGIEPDAVYSDSDVNALHIVHAVNSFRLPGHTSAETYLNIPLIVDICKQHKIDAVHPGYGFLAENAGFAQALDDAGIIFVGPSAKCIRDFGDKLFAKKLAAQAGVDCIPGTPEPVQSLEEGLAAFREIKPPVIIKAAAGGGGRGMRVVRTEDEFAKAFRASQSESLGAFGSDKVFLEKYIEKPRHIEFQILGDSQGNVIHLGERECSVQRRHQKLLEEAPSPALSAKLRDEMGAVAVKVAKSGGYHGAGTVEFLLDAKGRYYFMEMNARLQVEHPVTEMVTNTDLVREQILIAEGHKLEIAQEDVRITGHSIEARINAEDPFSDFLPALGKLNRYLPPMGNGVRLDSSAYEGYEIPLQYDSMIGKLITHAHDRATAIAKMQRALEEFIVTGVKTTIPFHEFVMAHPDFVKGSFSTSFVDEHFTPREIEKFLASPGQKVSLRDAAIAAALIYHLSQVNVMAGNDQYAPNAALQHNAPYVMRNRRKQ